MRLANHPGVHLTYCTNIHPADGWAGVRASLARYAPALKARLSPQDPFGLGLRLSARDARELLAGEALQEFKAFLEAEGLYVALINGFPYGPFHGTPVKAAVYAPDWRDEARLRYTADLIDVLGALVPDGVDGGISTAPLSYKPWMASADAHAWDLIVGHVVSTVERLVRTREQGGPLLHLDIEPEPDCTLETTAETLHFYEAHLLRSGAGRLAARLGIGDAAARDHLLEHVRVCFDCCHFAVEFEEAAEALDRLRAAGIRIGRIQLSSALDVRIPADPAAAADLRRHLRSFADSTYLHQVVEQGAAGRRQYADLGEALDHAGADGARRWRIHFHVPLFTERYETLGSTQRYVADVLAHALRTGATTHLEIETYTWDVLPTGLKLDVGESIAREYEWVLETIAAGGASGAPAPQPGAGR